MVKKKINKYIYYNFLPFQLNPSESPTPAMVWSQWDVAFFFLSLISLPKLVILLLSATYALHLHFRTSLEETPDHLDCLTLNPWALTHCFLRPFTPLLYSWTLIYQVLSPQRSLLPLSACDHSSHFAKDDKAAKQKFHLPLPLPIYFPALVVEYFIFRMNCSPVNIVFPLHT